jgi:ABC-type sugar transport system substrate-binding protein
MKKKLFTIFLLAVIMALGLISCNKTPATGSNAGTAPAAGSSPGAAAAVTEGLPVKGNKSSHLNSGTAPINIAFVIYSWTDDQGQYIQQYGNYLAKNFNITVEYDSAENSAEATIDMVETLCSKGVDGIILANQKGFQSWAAICEENKVYYSIMLGQLDDEDDRAYAATCKYFQGSLGNYDYSFLGEIYAQHTLDKGYKNILIAGAAPGMQVQTDQMIAGYCVALDKAGVTYKIVRAAFNQLFTAVAAALAAETYDIVYCPISMMNFAVSNIYANKLVGKTKAMGHGTSEDLEDAIKAGVVDMITDNMTSDVGVNVAFIINAVEGNVYPDWPANECVNIRAPSFVVISEDDYSVYTKNVRNYDANPFLCDMAAVKSMILSYNSGATFGSIKNYIETMSLDKLR